jgi:hypothetical protein
VNPQLASVPIGRVTRAWNVAVSGADLYQYKVAFGAVDDCRDRRGYSPVRATRDRPVVDDALPPRDGWWLLCVVAGWSGRGETRWQSLRFPTVIVARVDTVRPRVPAPLAIDEEDLAWRVTFRGLSPEIAFYLYKFGRPADTRCQDPAGYRPALIPFINLLKRDRPFLFCAIPYDLAGNPGRLIEELLP